MKPVGSTILAMSKGWPGARRRQASLDDPSGTAEGEGGVDGFSRLSYTEPLPDEKGPTAAAFLARAKVWFAAHGITHIHRVVTDNGAHYRSGDFAGSSANAHGIIRPSRTPLAPTAKWSGTSESWPRNCSTPASLITRTPALP